MAFQVLSPSQWFNTPPVKQQGVLGVSMNSVLAWLSKYRYLAFRSEASSGDGSAGCPFPARLK